MYTPILLIFAALFLSFSTLLLAFVPYADGLVGRSAASGALGSALIFLLLTLIFGLSAATLPGWLLAGAAGLTLSLMLLSYILFQSRNKNAQAEQAKSTRPENTINCRSRLIYGQPLSNKPHVKTWRTYLYTDYSTNPTHGALVEQAKVWGGIYYGIYYTTRTITASPTLVIVCENCAGENGSHCLAYAGETGNTSLSSPPVSIEIANVVSLLMDRVQVTVAMGAALNASGGPSLAIAPGGIGPTLSFPDTSHAMTTAMGTYRWRCEPGEPLAS